MKPWNYSYDFKAKTVKDDARDPTVVHPEFLDMWWDIFVTSILPLLQQHGAIKDTATGVKAVCLILCFDWDVGWEGLCPLLADQPDEFLYTKPSSNGVLQLACLLILKKKSSLQVGTGKATEWTDNRWQWRQPQAGLIYKHQLHLWAVLTRERSTATEFDSYCKMGERISQSTACTGRVVKPPFFTSAVYLSVWITCFPKGDRNVCSLLNTFFRLYCWGWNGGERSLAWSTSN